MKNNTRMNRQEMIMAGTLGLLLVAWLFYQAEESKKIAAYKLEQARIAATNVVEKVALPEAGGTGLRPVVTNDFKANEGGQSLVSPSNQDDAGQRPAPLSFEPDLPRAEEIFAGLENESLRLKLSSHGGVVRSAELLQYPLHPKGEERVAFQYDATPLLAWNNIPGLPANAAYSLVESGATFAVFGATNRHENLLATRRYELKDGHNLVVTDTLRNIGDAPLAIPAADVSLGSVSRGLSKNDMIGVDTLQTGAKKVFRLEKTLAQLVGGSSGTMGCGGGTATRESGSEILDMSC